MHICTCCVFLINSTLKYIYHIFFQRTRNGTAKQQNVLVELVFTLYLHVSSRVATMALEDLFREKKNPLNFSHIWHQKLMPPLIFIIMQTKLCMSHRIQGMNIVYKYDYVKFPEI
ncbi:hypothetical protein CR513_14968, partial [Mucuna pruriens]